jgi:NDP-sugar pyrophosphorylase family protein
LIDRAIEAGGRSVSDIVADFMARDRFATVAASHPIWQDVDTPEMAREAEQLLLNRLPHLEAGTTGARHIRPLSPR